jgi:hypothetical protein
VDGIFGIAWVTTLLVVILMIHGFWRRPNPNHEFILDLEERFLGEKNGSDSKQS